MIMTLLSVYISIGLLIGLYHVKSINGLLKEYDSNPEGLSSDEIEVAEKVNIYVNRITLKSFNALTLFVFGLFWLPLFVKAAVMYIKTKKGDE